MMSMFEQKQEPSLPVLRRPYNIFDDNIPPPGYIIKCFNGRFGTGQYFFDVDISSHHKIQNIWVLCWGTSEGAMGIF